MFGQRKFDACYGPSVDTVHSPLQGSLVGKRIDEDIQSAATGQANIDIWRALAISQQSRFPFGPCHAGLVGEFGLETTVGETADDLTIVANGKLGTTATRETAIYSNDRAESRRRNRGMPQGMLIITCKIVPAFQVGPMPAIKYG